MQIDHFYAYSNLTNLTFFGQPVLDAFPQTILPSRNLKKKLNQI